MVECLEQRRRREEGFTLVELLVVIVVLGILASIVVFAVGGITERGSGAADSTDVSLLQAAEEAAFAQSAVFPALYLGEQALLDGGRLRTPSTMNDICLSDSVPAAGGHPAIPAAVNYEIVAHTQDASGVTTTICGAGFTLAP